MKEIAAVISALLMTCSSVLGTVWVIQHFGHMLDTVEAMIVGQAWGIVGLVFMRSVYTWLSDRDRRP